MGVDADALIGESGGVIFRTLQPDRDREKMDVSGRSIAPFGKIGRPSRGAITSPGRVSDSSRLTALIFRTAPPSNAFLPVLIFSFEYKNPSACKKQITMQKDVESLQNTFEENIFYPC
jgi:hypothetical protein